MNIMQAVEMIYIQGDLEKPGTWQVNHITNYKIGLFEALMGPFHSEKDARLWIIKELRRRVKEINVVKHRWMHPEDIKK